MENVLVPLNKLRKRIVPDTKLIRVVQSHFVRMKTDCLTKGIDGAKLLEQNRKFVPKELCLEITNICNSNCIFCEYQFQKRPKGIMNDKVYQTAIRSFAELSVNRLRLTPFVGEVFVDPNFLEKIKDARKVGYTKISFATNGIFLDKHGINKILDSGVTEIGISTSAFDPVEYEQIYRNKLYNRMLQNVSLLLRRNMEKGRPVKINLLFRSSRSERAVLATKDYLKYIKPYANGTGDVVFLKYIDNRGGEIRAEHMRGLMVPRQSPKIKNVPCYRSYMPYVLYDGKVMACSCTWSEKYGSNQLIIGNILHEPLKEILFGERIYNIRKRFIDNKLIDVCGNCSFYIPAKL